MKSFLISSLMVLTLILHAGEIDIISMAKSGKITESREQLNQLPAGIKKSIVTYKLAEYCFDQGELKTAEELLKEFMATADSVEYRKKLSGYTRRSKTMLEYISRYGDANVTKTLKKAQALVEQRECSNETLLDNISVFSGRAVNWKERGIAEYDQLLQLIQKLLDRIEDKGNTEVAVKVALLRCRLLRLEGENRQCLEILEQCLRYYYPETLKHYYRPQPYPVVARRLLCEMGEQFAALAEKSNNTNEKIDYYSRAAASLVKSTIRLPLDNDEFNIAQEHILRYREALRLLGYKLNIDAKFLNQSASPELDMYRGMLEQKRFTAAVKAMQNLIVKNRDAGKDISPELNLLYARALCGAEQYTQAVEICDKLPVGQDLPQDTVDIIMDMAYTARGKGAENEALEFFIRLKKLVPSHPDRKMYLQDCAALAIKLEHYEVAAECFLELASMHNNPDAKALALFNAAQSQCKLHDYSRAVETGKQALALPDVSTQLKHKIGFMIGQSAMMMAKNKTEDSEKSHYLAIATEQFNSLCNDSTLDEKLKQQALLLGGIASYYDKKMTKAIRFFELYMNNFARNDADTTLRVAGYLSILYSSQKQYRELSTLFDTLLKYFPDTPATLELILLCGHRFVESNHPEQALTTYRSLLGTRNMQASRLLKVCTELKSDTFSQEKKKSTSLIYDLVRKQLPPNLDDNVNGALYFYLAQATFDLEKYHEANEYIDRILSQKKIYNYYESKLLHAEIMKKTHRLPDAIKDYQEILLSGSTQAISTRTNALMAQCLYDSGNFKKALAISWSIVPLSGKLPSDKQQQEIIRQNLELVKLCAQKLNSTEDITQIDKIYNELFGEPQNRNLSR